MSAAYFQVVDGSSPVAYPLAQGESLAGRAPGVALLLSNPEVSRHHCRFQWDGESCTVEDLGSRRGTLVNGERISAPVTIQPGDKVGVGPVVLLFGLGEAPRVEHSEPHNAGAAESMLVRGQPADRIPVAGELTIGRDPEGDVVLNDPAVSRRHATVRSQAGAGCVVTDLHSTAGSFINGHRFDSQGLTVGDKLQIGPFTFVFDGQSLVRSTASAGAEILADKIVASVGQLKLLSDLTVRIAPSVFTGILGPSGAGKSTLLHSLSGLRQPESGRVLVDRQPVYGNGGVHPFGFVPQEDIVHPELTVSEALRFNALLRLPAATPALELQKLILQTMDQLGLRERSGHSISRLSGGQRKRVSVAVELLARPAVLFLDEPSSGLDPATEFQLMELLRDLADSGCTVVCTTHVMEHAFLMDQLLVLSAGRLVFQGTAEQAREHFKVGKLTGLYDRLQERSAEDWSTEWQRRELARMRGRSADAAPAAGKVPARQAPPGRRWALPILLQRQWTMLRADWRNFLILFGQPLIIGSLVSWVSDDSALLLFFAYVSTLWFGCSNAAQEIVRETAIYRRERLVGVSTHSYLLSKYLFLGALTVLQAALIYACLQVGEGGIGGSATWQILALLGTAFAAVGIGSAISALARNTMQAVLAVPLILIPQILFSGYTVPVHEMKPAVYAVSRPMPSFSAQVLMDTSFLWQQPIARTTLSDHWTSFRNLNRDNRLRTGDVYRRWEPGILAFAMHLVWLLGSYVIAAVALRKKGTV